MNTTKIHGLNIYKMGNLAADYLYIFRIVTSGVVPKALRFSRTVNRILSPQCYLWTILSILAFLPFSIDSYCLSNSLNFLSVYTAANLV